MKDSRPAKDTTDLKIAELDQKWSDLFNRLEALLLAKILDKEPSFQTVKVDPSHSPPAGAVKSTEPFIRLTDPAATHSTPASSSLPAITQPSASHRQASRKDSISSLESEADSEFSDRPLLDLYVEEGDLSADQDVTVTDQGANI